MALSSVVIVEEWACRVKREDEALLGFRRSASVYYRGDWSRMGSQSGMF